MVAEAGTERLKMKVDWVSESHLSHNQSMAPRTHTSVLLHLDSRCRYWRQPPASVRRNTSPTSHVFDSLAQSAFEHGHSLGWLNNHCLRSTEVVILSPQDIPWGLAAQHELPICPRLACAARSSPCHSSTSSAGGAASQLAHDGSR